MYIVVEKFPCPELAAIVTDPDTGENMVFATYTEAENECDNLQDGVIVEI